MFASMTVLAASLFGFSCGTELPQVVLTVAGQQLSVEVASTPQTRACGLSQRHSMSTDRGMLFVFPQAAVRTFWMKDTHLSLSIAFLDAAKVILNVHAMTPLQTEERYPSDGMASYALEVNAGWFEANGVEVGDAVEFHLPRVLTVE